MNKKEDKFQFVTMDDIQNEDNNEQIKVIDVPTKVSVSKKEEKEKTKNIEDNSNYKDDTVYQNSSKFYFGFKSRIIVMILVIVCLFISACFLILNTLNASKTEYITYSENGNSNYQVCYIDGNCLEEEKIYNSANINSISANINYNINYSEEYKYNINYHVVAITTIYDKNDTSKILYIDEQTLVDTTNISDKNKEFSISEDVSIDYLNANKIAIDYKDIYKNEYKSKIEVVLYLDNPDDTSRKVSSINIPLNEENFEITKNYVNNSNQKQKINSITWNEYNTLYAVGASVLVLISLVLIYQTTQLVIKTANSNRSEYEQKILQILRKYDNIIVIARGGYKSNEDREIIKVDNFDKLLDVKDHVDKPIIYSKISNVKCEFMIDTGEKLYKLVMLDEKV